MIFSESTFEPKMVHLFTNMFSINWQIRNMNHIWTTNTWGWLLELLPRAVDHFPFSFLKLISCQIFLSINDFMPNLAWQKFSQKNCPIEIPRRRKQGNDLVWNSYQVNCFYISFLATWRFLQVAKKESVGKVLAFTEWVALFGCRNDLPMARNLPQNSTFLPILL